MSNIVRVRVEIRDEDDRYIAFRKMLTAFRKAVADAGILHSHKQHETFESNARKDRRKKQEHKAMQLKNKWRENFS